MTELVMQSGVTVEITVPSPAVVEVPAPSVPLIQFLPVSGPPGPPGPAGESILPIFIDLGGPFDSNGA